jgi:hypothetical protein
MGIIKEPLEVDFFVDPKPLTKEEMETISDFIEADKKHRKQIWLKKRHIRTTNLQPSTSGHRGKEAGCGY